MEQFDQRLSMLFSRRSIRKYEKRPVPDDHIDSMLKAAMAAPSAKALDPWRFIVIKNTSALGALAGGLPNGKMLADAPLGITVCGDINSANGGELSYLLQDCCAAVENLLLAANALGLGACWLGVHPRPDRIAHVAGLMGLPENIIPVCCIAIGYPAEKKAPRTRYRADYVRAEKW